jgi:hypothetical protein
MVSLAKLVVAAIEAERVAEGFEINSFDVDYDWGGRAEEELTENDVYVRVVIPPTYAYALLDDRSGSWAHGVSLAIEIRSKIGVRFQESRDQEIERSRISTLARTVEQLHEFFPAELTARRLTLADHSKIAEWVSERERLTSAIEVCGSVSRLNQNRMFLGVLREAFEITDGT